MNSSTRRILRCVLPVLIALDLMLALDAFFGIKHPALALLLGAIGGWIGLSWSKTKAPIYQAGRRAGAATSRWLLK